MARNSSGPDSRQAGLPFGEAEGTNAERKNVLGMALIKVKADLHLAQFCLWVFNATHGGVEGRLVKSYEELAAAPWGLCCGRTKARETVEAAKRHYLVDWYEPRSANGGRTANEYFIDWEGVKAAIGLDVVMGGVIRHPPMPPRGTPVPPRGTPVPPRGLYIRNNTFPNTDSESESESEGPRPRKVEDFRTQTSPRTVADGTARWFDEVPELREAAARRIAPLPPAGLVYGAFKPIETADLASGVLVRWFRRQLSLGRPLTGDTEADLLLVLAAGLAADRKPQAEVVKSRVGIFSTTVSRGLWSKVLFCVPAARELLDRLLARFPDCLDAADGVGQAAEAVSQETVSCEAGGNPLQGVCDGTSDKTT